MVQGNSKILIGGSVYRDHGPFWDLFNLDLSQTLGKDTATLLRNHIRFTELYWWQVPWLINKTARSNPDVVAKSAPMMDTRDRVMEFGSDRLKLIFATMPIEDFKQEFELCAMREGTSLVPWDFILRASKDPEHGFVDSIDELNKWAFDEGITLYGGYDVGHRSNNSELSVAGYFKNSDYLVEKYCSTFTNKQLPEQEDYLRSLLRRVPQLVLAIDAGGLGAQMATKLHKEFRTRVIPVEFEYYSKLGIFDSFANRIVNGNIKLVADQERRIQIHSIKKKTSEAGRVVYYVPRKEKHHADKAVSQALMVHAAESNAVGAPFALYTGGSTATINKDELSEIAGTREEYMNEVVNG